MRSYAVVFTLGLTFLGGCSEPPKTTTVKKEEPKKAPEPISGKSAFFKVFVAARTWAPDAQCLTVSSIPMEEVKSQPGKSGAWQVTVVSPSKLRKRTYTWSAVESEGNLHEGVYPGADEAFNPNSTVKPFLIAALKTDTDAALKVAEEKSAEYMKKNPSMRINYLLELGTKHPNPAWRVIWGDSVGTSGHSVFVDATTGQYLETRH
ncbi:MAG: hypothetical protein HYX27_16455 [Acidobacteria bacterium]|nr:hypothetical protein [Acidobacteriota bacterium]